MKIYFNKAFVETKRETEDLWVQRKQWKRITSVC